MKYISFVFIVVVLLSFASCADSRAGAGPSGPTGSGGISGETGENNIGDQDTGSDSGPNAGDPGRVYDIRLSKAFKALCHEAAEAADQYLIGAVTAKETQARLFVIVEKMTEEYGRLPEGDSQTAGAGAIMMAMQLHDNINAGAPEDIEKIILLRDMLENYSKHR